MITLYNTLTRRKETFEPIEPGKVKMYVCGPTVYNYIHIGNARPAINYDVVRRYFEYKGYEVIYVSNFTDVDDKLINRSKELNESVPEIAEKYIKAFYEDVGALNVKKATSNPRVMHHMGEIIDFIKELVDEGYAYESDGDVYFRTRQFDGYGKLSHQSLDDLKVGARIEAGEQKEDALDFTLWKKAKPGEISWNSPFGKGRPGWHIECSVMAYHELGSTIDIHAGGSDLQFPHHENEIAQSEGATGEQYVNYWMHVGFVNVDGEKMSKSLGNFFTIRDVMEKFHPEVIRYFILSSHYRSPINFSDSALKEAKNALTRFYQTNKAVHNIDEVQQILASIKLESVRSTDAYQRFVKAMSDDFNTPEALSILFELSRETNRAIKAEEWQQTANAYAALKALCEILNIAQHDVDEFLKSDVGAENSLSNDEVEAQIQARADAKKAKNFAEADAIRQALLDQGVVLEDSRQGTTWRRVD